MNSRIRIFSTLFLLLSSMHVLARDIDTSLLPSLGDVDYRELKSETLDRSFHIFIDLPPGHAESQATYPTIYLLDGGITFPLLASYSQYLLFGEEVPPSIIVGISYGGATFEEGNFRSTDFTAPSDERDFWGGAAKFQQVLQQELFPLIENNYRSNASQRIILGHSLGGQFVLFNALTKPALFYGHIASNPALHRNLPFFLQWQGQNAMPDNASRVFVSSGEYDAERFRVPALKWIEHWQTTQNKPWLLETRTLHGHSHFSAVPMAFRQGMAWIFTDQD